MGQPGLMLQRPCPRSAGRARGPARGAAPATARAAPRRRLAPRLGATGQDRVPIPYTRTGCGARSAAPATSARPGATGQDRASIPYTIYPHRLRGAQRRAGDQRRVQAPQAQAAAHGPQRRAQQARALAQPRVRQLHLLPDRGRRKRLHLLRLGPYEAGRGQQAGAALAEQATRPATRRSPPPCSLEQEPCAGPSGQGTKQCGDQCLCRLTKACRHARARGTRGGAP